MPPTHPPAGDAFQDAWNPTESEIRDWAYDPDSYAPEQDWELAVAVDEHLPLILELAADRTCRKRRFFFACLYLYVGDAVRTQYRAHPRRAVEALLAAAPAGDAALDRWKLRSFHLLAHPEEFDYDAWCSWGYAAEDA